MPQAAPSAETPFQFKCARCNAALSHAGNICGACLNLTRTQEAGRHYMRAMNRWLEQRDIPRVNRQVPAEFIPHGDRKATLEIYLRDSLLWALEELEAGRAVHAFRGLLQVAGYSAVVGHDSTSQDATLFLRNEVEAVIQGGEAFRCLDTSPRFRDMTVRDSIAELRSNGATRA